MAQRQLHLWPPTLETYSDKGECRNAMRNHIDTLDIDAASYTAGVQSLEKKAEHAGNTSNMWLAASEYFRPLLKSILDERMECCLTIAGTKVNDGIVQHPEREQEVRDNWWEWFQRAGFTRQENDAVVNALLEISRAAQEEEIARLQRVQS